MVPPGTSLRFLLWTAGNPAMRPTDQETGPGGPVARRMISRCLFPINNGREAFAAFRASWHVRNTSRPADAGDGPVR